MTNKRNATKPIIDVMPAAVSKRPLWFDWRKLKAANRKVVLGAVLVLLVLSAGYFYHQHQRTKVSSGQSKINETVNKVGKLFLLPTGEQPTLAIVNDASKYNSVSFFKNAANGDRLLVYAQAREAILYRPSIN